MISVLVRRYSIQIGCRICGLLESWSERRGEGAAVENEGSSGLQR